MNDFIAKIQNKANETTVIFTSWIALILTALGCLNYFFSFGFDFRLPSFLGVIFLLSTIIPPALLTIYLTRAPKNPETSKFAPVIFGFSALDVFFIFVDRFLYGLQIYTVFDLIYIALKLVLLVCFIVVLLKATKGIINEKLITVTLLIGIISELPRLLSFISYIQIYLSNGIYVYLLTTPMQILGRVVFYISLFLFSIKVKKPVAIKNSSDKTADGEFSPEQTLKLLKDKFERGAITEEEYQTQRAEIINKL